MIFTRDEWKSLPNRLTSDKKSLFTVTHGLFFVYFSYAFPFRHAISMWHIYMMMIYYIKWAIIMIIEAIWLVLYYFA